MSSHTFLSNLSPCSWSNTCLRSNLSRFFTHITYIFFSLETAEIFSPYQIKQLRFIHQTVQDLNLPVYFLGQINPHAEVEVGAGTLSTRGHSSPLVPPAPPPGSLLRLPLVPPRASHRADNRRCLWFRAPARFLLRTSQTRVNGP